MSQNHQVEQEHKAVQVAVASKDQRQINEHFGHASGFHIYKVTAGAVDFLETRQVEHYCQGGYGDEDKRDAILRVLQDCRALFIAKVGDGPKARLEQAGIVPVDDYPYGLIAPSLIDWYGRQSPP